MVSAARLGHILVKRGGGAALLHSHALCPAPLQHGWYRLMSQSSRGDRVGPDRILPANSLSTTWPDGAVEIRFSDKHPLCQEKPISVSGHLSGYVGHCVYMEYLPVLAYQNYF